MSTAGKLLVATPRTGGEIFHRSVVLMLHHSPDGAHGVVLNKPVPATLADILPDWQEHLTEPAHLFRGGPVGTDTALGLAATPLEGDGPSMGIHRLFRGVGVVDLDAPPLLVMPEVTSFRVFAGYAGWSGGQLEDELTYGAWAVVAACRQDVFTDEPDDLWHRVLHRQHNSLSWLTRFPEDPALN